MDGFSFCRDFKSAHKYADRDTFFCVCHRLFEKKNRSISELWLCHIFIDKFKSMSKLWFTYDSPKFFSPNAFFTESFFTENIIHRKFFSPKIFLQENIFHRKYFSPNAVFTEYNFSV
jgi:hypothetical protein